MRSERIAAVGLFATLAIACTRAEPGVSIGRAPESGDASPVADARDAAVSVEASYEIKPVDYAGWPDDKLSPRIGCGAVGAPEIAWLALGDEVVAFDLRSKVPMRRWRLATRACSIVPTADGKGAYVARMMPTGVELTWVTEGRAPTSLASTTPYARGTIVLHVERERVHFGAEGQPTRFAYDLATRHTTVVAVKEMRPTSTRITQQSGNHCAVFQPTNEAQEAVLCVDDFDAPTVMTERRLYVTTLEGTPHGDVMHEGEAEMGIRALLPVLSGVWMIRIGIKLEMPTFIRYRVTRRA